MTQLLEDINEVMFTLKDQFNLDVYAPKDFKMAKMLLRETRKLALDVMVPVNKIGDQIGAKFEEGHVILPNEYHDL